MNVESKGPQDFVSAADRAVERLIAERVASSFPGDGFLGVESPPAIQNLAAPLWVVDSIDGTTNYIQGRADWCFSIAVVSAGQPQIGVVFDPTGGDLYAALRGWGAVCNGDPIRVTTGPRLSRPLSASTTRRADRLPIIYVTFAEFWRAEANIAVAAPQRFRLRTQRVCRTARSELIDAANLRRAIEREGRVGIEETILREVSQSPRWATNELSGSQSNLFPSSAETLWALNACKDDEDLYVTLAAAAVRLTSSSNR